MEPNYFNTQYPLQYPNYPQPQASQQGLGANAVSINIFGPQAYSSNPIQQQAPQQGNPNFYPMYGVNPNPGMPMYPSNYNNMITPPQDNSRLGNSLQAVGDGNTDMYNHKSSNDETSESISTKKTEKDDKDDKTKTKKVTPLTDEYVQSLENYLNNDNPKIRLIGAKELMERFKEDENRVDNPSLVPLLNKTLKDTSSAVRFLGLTTLQLGYCVGNDETVSLLKQIQSQNQDKVGEDSLLASEILLKLSAGQQIELEEVKS